MLKPYLTNEGVRHYIYLALALISTAYVSILAVYAELAVANPDWLRAVGVVIPILGASLGFTAAANTKNPPTLVVSPVEPDSTG